MAITPADVSVAANGNIRWAASADGSGPYTVLELHRFLQDLADDAQASGDDLVDITSDTPSERSTDNIISLLGTYNADAELIQHFYDGSISQDGGDDLYSGLVVVGSVYSSTTLMIIQENALYDDGVHTPSSPFWGTDLNADVGANILMRCMILTRTGGTDIDSRKIRIQARELGDTYAEFEVTMGLGNSTAAIFTTQDLNNETAGGTIATWSTITNETEGYNNIDLNNGEGAQPYYSEWNRDSYTINQLYERAKWLTQRGSISDSSADVDDLYGMDGELFRGITHQVSIGSPTGTFNAYEPVSWDGVATGTGQMLAIDSPTAGTLMWIQLLTGAAPANTDTITGAHSGATAAASGTATSRTLSPCFLGQSTGTSIIGAYGIGIESGDLTNADKLFDLANTQRQPPNNVTFTVTGLADAEDRVLVGPDTGSGALDFDQLTTSTSLSGGTNASVTVSAAIPSDTPQVGTIRVLTDGGIYRRVEYSSWATSTFTFTANEDFTSDPSTSAKNLFISYIDKECDSSNGEEEFTAVYSTDRALFVRVRDGGGTPIKTFETPATLGSAGGSVAAIRTSDA